MKRIILLIFSLFSFFPVLSQANNHDKITLVIHGGAGNISREALSAAKEKEYRAKMEEALTTGYNILEKGGTSLNAVVAAIKILEDSPLFNAGKGAVFTNQMTNELDASIMDGKTKKAGAVAGVTKIKNPIEAALAVMNNSPHVMLAGRGAEDFASNHGIELVDPAYFHDEERMKQLKNIQQREQIRKEGKGMLDGPGNDWLENQKFGTVGAVALDIYGNIAAGTSTGGMANKKWGRIGDSPIIGAGTYADNNTCGVSSTGHGEYFIRYQVAYDIAALMKYKGLSLEAASNEVVLKILVEAGGDGGVIALDREGNVAMPFNTAGMFRGYVKHGKKPVVMMFKQDH